MKVCILAAGAGQRFKDEGFKVPKVLLPVPKDKTSISMIDAVIDNVVRIFEQVDEITQVIVLKQKGQEIDYGNFQQSIEIVEIDVEGITEGALCTALLAKQYLDTNQSVVIVNSDQLIEVDTINFKTFYKMIISGENFLFSFKPEDESNKWSFVQLDDNNHITKVVEKEKISDVATCGLYFFSDGYNFVDVAEKMIKQNIRTNGEYYLAPTYNHFPFYTTSFVFNVSNMVGLGTPADYKQYLNSFQLDYDKNENKLVPMEVN